MADKFLSLILQIVVGLLDRWLDARIATAGWDGVTKQRAQLLEDELVKFLEGPIGLALAKAIGKALVESRFQNDPSTGNWG